MPTDKPRFSITVSEDIYQQINDYQHEHRLSTQTKAVLAFIEKGLEVILAEKKARTKISEGENIDAKGETTGSLLGSDVKTDNTNTKSPGTTEAAQGDEQEQSVMRLVSELTQDQQEFLLAWLKTTIELRKQKPPSPQE